jgi:hypothetical protein
VNFNLRIVFLATFMTTGVAMSNELVTWGEVLGSEIEPQWDSAEHRAFDFWIGEWEMNWRSKPEGEFHFDREGTWTHQRVFPVLGGKAILELAWDRDATADEPSQRGFSIRYYDEKRSRWIMAQNWPGPGNQGYAFLDQLIGFEDNGRLSMYSAIRRPQEDGSYQYGHRQYNFADIRDGAFRWDGSNSYDEGKTWMTWNVVDAGRIRPLDEFGAAGTAWPGYIGGQLCRDEPHGAYDFIEGAWSGTRRKADGSSEPVTLHAGRLLDGCALAMVVNIEGGLSIFSTLSYEPRSGNWVMYTLDNRPGVGHVYFWSPVSGSGATFHHAPALSIDNDRELYVVDENFDADAAQTRLVWQKVESDEIVIENQRRKEQDRSWSTVSTYSFIRNLGDEQ